MMKAAAESKVLHIKDNETAMTLVSAHFEKNKQKIDNIIRNWNRSDEERKSAFVFLYKSANCDQESFAKFLEEKFGRIKESDRGQGLTRRVLRIMNNQASGNDGESDCFEQTQKISIVKGSALKEQIGQFIRDETNKYLIAQNKELFEEVQKEEQALVASKESDAIIEDANAGVAEVSANDNIPAKDCGSPNAKRVKKEELEKKAE